MRHDHAQTRMNSGDRVTLASLGWRVRPERAQTHMNSGLDGDFSLC